MSRIVRRYLTLGPDGTPVFTRSEHVHEDEDGNLRLVERQWTRHCSGCLRHVGDLEQTRGICDACNIRECCVHCETSCALCARRLCGQCRIGYAAGTPASVCAVCFRRLSHRQAIQDELDQEQRAFDRWLAHQRLLHQDQMMQLNQRRLQLTESAQANRHQSGGRPALIPAIGWIARHLWMLATGIVRHVRRLVS